MVLNQPALSINDNLVPSSDLTSDSQEEVVTSLQEEGERALLEGDRKGLTLFEEAIKLAPTSADLFFRQGLVLLELGSRQNCLATLRKAADKFKQATKLSDVLGEAWHAWATTLESISKISGNPSDIWSAKDKMEKALELARPEMFSEVHWDAGVLYHNLACRSGEVDDLMQALVHFEKCCEEAMPAEFWNDFGKTYVALSEKLHDIRPVLKSIHCYKQALTKAVSNIEGWVGLSTSLKRLYQITYENDHFQQAYDCFSMALQLSPNQPELWLEQIEFLMDAARLKKDLAKLRKALEKCEQASIWFNPPQLVLKQDELETSADLEKEIPTKDSFSHSLYPRLLSLWAEALSLLGEWTDCIESIRYAEQKIQQALEFSKEEDIFVLLQHGKCLYSFGKYYHDIDLYYQAIEQLQAALSLDRTQRQGWHFMGKIYMTIFEHMDDADALEKSVRFYRKALQIQADPFLCFEISAALIQKGEIEQESSFVEQAIEYLEYLFQNYKLLSYEYPEWFFFYGRALDLLGELRETPSLYPKALDAFVTVLMFNPHYPLIHHRLGIVYSHLGEEFGEIDCFYRSLQHFRLAEKEAEEESLIYVDWAITWMQLAQHATDAYMEENCLQEAEQKLMHAVRLGNMHAFYQLACLYALKKATNTSFYFLHKAFSARTLPPLEEIQEDTWLESVRLLPEFQEFLALLQKN